MNGLSSINFKLTGVTPLIMHNPAPMLQKSPISEELARLLEKKDKDRTDTEKERIKQIQFLLSLYLNENNRVIVPGDMVRRSFLEGARKIKKGQLVESGLFTTGNHLLEYEGEKEPEKMMNTNIRFTCLGNINKMKVPITRAKFDQWSVIVIFNFLEEILDKKTLQNIAYKAGVLGGLGTFRKGGYGRYNAELVKG